MLGITYQCCKSYNNRHLLRFKTFIRAPLHLQLISPCGHPRCWGLTIKRSWAGGGGGAWFSLARRSFLVLCPPTPLSAPLPPYKFSSGPSLNPRKKVKDVWLEQTSVINDCRHYGLVRLDTFRSRQHILMFQVSLERTPSGILQHPDPIKKIFYPVFTTTIFDTVFMTFRCTSIEGIVLNVLRVTPL